MRTHAVTLKQRTCIADSGESLISQRHERIDAGGTARRNQTRCACHERE